MRHANLSPFTQFFLVGLLTVALVAVLTRAAVFIRREYTGMTALYPLAWTPAQCRVLECFRLLVGLALIPLWGTFLLIAPSMPTNWPFGLLEMMSLIVLVLLSHAWVLLLAPRHWGKFGAFPGSFWLTILFLMTWWISMFSATGLMLAKASAPRPRLIGPIGVFAALDTRPWTSPTSPENASLPALASRLLGCSRHLGSGSSSRRCDPPARAALV